MLNNVQFGDAVGSPKVIKYLLKYLKVDLYAGDDGFEDNTPTYSNLVFLLFILTLQWKFIHKKFRLFFI